MQTGCAQDEVIVTRAPGRLDVMGGIGDYSGCLVLQKPTAEACHVACQRHPLAKQKVWKHIQNRHKGHSKLAHSIACLSKRLFIENLRPSPCMQTEYMHIMLLSTAFSQLHPYQANMCKPSLESMLRGHCMLMIPTSSAYRSHLVFACHSVVGSRLYLFFQLSSDAFFQ